MDLRIKGRTALVLGASQGLGRAIAMRLAAEGANLIVASRSLDRLSALAGELAGEHGVKARAVEIDMSDAGAVDAFCRAIAEDHRPDILVNNAGGPPPSAATGVADEVWQKAAHALLFSVIKVSEAALAAMRERGWGRILTIASSGVVQPIPNLAVSNTIRSGVVGFSKSLANEEAANGITVNMILPGRIETERLGQLDRAAAERQGKPIEEVQKANRATIPMQRYGRPEEFADAAAFLLSERASYVTGHMMRVDGGLIRSV